MIRLQKAKPRDCLKIWKWRNEPGVRSVSVNNKIIPLETHKIWYSNKIKDPGVRILIAKNLGNPYGYARIEKTERNCGEIHIAVTKASRGKGLGLLLLQKSCAHAFIKMRFGEITARIKPENKRSIGLFKRAGFVPVTSKKTEKKILTFRLKKAAAKGIEK